MKLIRHLLDIPKARVLATLKAAKIPFIEDPSNQDPRFARTRLRGLAPALAREGLDAARLAVLAQRFGRAEQALARATEQARVHLCRKGSSETRETVMRGREFPELTFR